MSIDEMREAIAQEMSAECTDQWFTVLNDTTPGHYGAEIPEFEIDFTDIWIDIPRKTFSFKRGELSVGLRLNASSDADGVDMDFNLTVSGNGQFCFENGKVKVRNFQIYEDLDLFGDRVRARVAN